jgi:hypothetical protein
MTVLPDFKQFCEMACVKFWGEPDERTPKYLRWNGGNAYGERTYNVRKRTWYDAGGRCGGSTLDLAAHAMGKPVGKGKLRGAAVFEAWRYAYEHQWFPVPPPEKETNSGLPPILRTFPYPDEQGVLLGEVVRFDTPHPKKRFKQRRPDGKGGWEWKAAKRQVLFRLPQLIEGAACGYLVLNCEGEHDCETAVRLGYVATCNPGGVGKWRAEYDEYFRGADIVVVGDNDPQAKDPKTGVPLFHADGRPVHKGQDDAEERARRLSKVAARVRKIGFDVKDLTEWVDAGHTREELDALIAVAEDFVPLDAKQPEPAKANGGAMPRKPAFTLFRDLEASPVKHWLVEGMLGDGEASVMYGKPGDGKSVLAEDLALHVPAGRAWHGRKVKQGAVLYIALERRKLVERRAIAFRKKHSLSDLPFAIMGGVYDFRQPQTVATICQIVAELEATTGQDVILIVIDTLSRALCGGDENSSKDMGAIVAATGRLQSQSSAHVMWLHHTPLSSDDRLRGHGALLGAIDTTIHVDKGADGMRTGTVIKTNDAEEGETVAFTLDSITIGQNAAGKDTTAPVVVAIEGVRRRQVQRKSERRMARSAKIAQRALAKAIDEMGETPPASNHIPQGVRVVAVEAWRDYAFRQGISHGEEPAKRAAFRRAYEFLVDESIVAVWGDYAWMAR